MILDRKKEYSLLIFLFFCTLGLRVYFLLHSDNLPGDAVTRSLYGQYVFKNWPPFIIHTWLPLHFYLMGLVLKLWNNFPFALRVFHLVLGALTIFPYYFAIKEIFGKKAAFFSAVIFAFLAYHIISSTFTLSHTVFLFFLFSALCFFFKFLNKEKKVYLIFSGIFLTLTCGIRYEGWLFIFLLLPFLWKNRKKYILLFLLLSSLVPIYWILGNYFFTGNMFSFYTIRRDNLILCYSEYPMKELLVSWINIIWQGFTFAIMIPAVIGLFYAIWKRKQWQFAYFFLIFFLITIYSSLSKFLSKDITYTLNYKLYLIPYTAVGLQWLLHKFREKYFNYALSICAVIFVLFSMFDRWGKFASTYKVPTFCNEMALWLKNNIEPDGKIVLDDYRHLGSYMLAQSGLDFEGEAGLSKKNVFWVYDWPNETVDEVRLNLFLHTKSPVYLIIADNGKLNNIFPFSFESKRGSKYGYNFDCIYWTGVFKVYKRSQ